VSGAGVVGNKSRIVSSDLVLLLTLGFLLIDFNSAALSASSLSSVPSIRDLPVEATRASDSKGGRYGDGDVDLDGDGDGDVDPDRSCEEG
jgi:hypothetical protein